MKITKKTLENLIEDVLTEMEMAEEDDPDCDKWAEHGFESREACCEDNPKDCEEKSKGKESTKQKQQIKKESKNMKITKKILE